MTDKKKKWFTDILVDVFSGVLLAAAIYSFAVPAGFPMSGVSGIALILYRLFGTPVGTMTVLLNIPITLVCYRTLGRQFYLRSMKTVAITSVIMDVLGPRLPAYHGELLLAAICAGVLCGIGYGAVFMRGSSTGGFDFIIMTVRHYEPQLSAGRIAFVQDAAVIGAGAALLGSVDAAIYGWILSYLYSRVMDKVLYGGGGKLTMIITDLPREMVRAVDEIAGRGATILKATGGYSGEDKQVVLCASNNKEMYAIRKRAHEVDPGAFVIIVESNEVIGEGFQAPEQA